MSWLWKLGGGTKHLYYRARILYVLPSQWHELRAKGIRQNVYPALGVVFVHIPRTAGTSLHEFFSRLDDQAVAENFTPMPELLAFAEFRDAQGPEYHKHMKAKRYVSVLGAEQWSKTRSIAVVRNPWDLAVSTYHWWLEKGTRFPRHLKDALCVRRMSGFDEFVRSELFAQTTGGYPGHMRDWFQKDGGDIVSFIACVESLNNDIQSFVSVAGLPVGSAKIPRRNSTQRTHYQGYFTKETKEIIRRQYAYIIDRFGYQFEDETSS